MYIEVSENNVPCFNLFDAYFSQNLVVVPSQRPSGENRIKSVLVEILRSPAIILFI